MTRLVRILVALVIVAAAAAPAAAQEGLSKRVSLDLKAMAPPEAFKALADAVGLTVVLDPAVTAPVDILVRNVKASTALDAMCDSIGCAWSVAGTTLTIRQAPPWAVKRLDRGTVVRQLKPEFEEVQSALRKPLPADMKFENTPLPVVSQRLSDALGIRVTVTSDDPSIQTLTADLGNKTLLAGLKDANGGQEPRPAWRIALMRHDTAVGLKPTLELRLGFRTRPAKK